MNLFELIRDVRETAQDTSTKNQLWRDEVIISYLNEGQVEACRNKILRSSSLSLGEEAAKAELTITGTSGVISSILVNKLNIISTPIAFNTSDIITAAELSNEINSTGVCEANVIDNVVEIIAPKGLGASINNIVPIVIQTNSLCSISKFKDGLNGICKIDLKPGVREYNYSKKIIGFSGFALGDSQKPLCLQDYSLLDACQRSVCMQNGEVSHILYGVSNESFYVGQIPTVKDYITATVYHLPLKEMRNNKDIPEIPTHLHSKLVHYALYKMYQKNDIEVNQLDISSFHRDKFIEEFGDNTFNSAYNNALNQRFFFGD
jgi:hypothetical protein